jgi:hypothetical protein
MGVERCRLPTRTERVALALASTAGGRHEIIEIPLLDWSCAADILTLAIAILRHSVPLPGAGTINQLGQLSNQKSIGEE